MNFSGLMKKVPTVYYKKRRRLCYLFLYDIILNVVELEFKTKLLNVTQSGYTLEGHLRAIEECVQTDEFIANQEHVLSADLIFHQAREITKQNLRVLSMKKPIPIDQLKSVPCVGSTAAGKGYVSNKRDKVDKAVSHS